MKIVVAAASTAAAYALAAISAAAAAAVAAAAVRLIGSHALAVSRCDEQPVNQVCYTENMADATVRHSSAGGFA